jgi:hypothetical protein
VPTGSPKGERGGVHQQRIGDVGVEAGVGRRAGVGVCPFEEAGVGVCPFEEVYPLWRREAGVGVCPFEEVYPLWRRGLSL